jgi:polyribonucleotide nucleotidyltransferase
MTFKSSKESKVTVQSPFHSAPISFETGWIAKQAGGAVMVRQGDTMVLCTVCRAAAKPGQSFFPMTVEYQEKSYAAGKIPGGFFKREGRPGEGEILSCRIIDRPIRPLFPEGYMDEVQIICTVMSSDGIHSPDVLALCGASAALHISDVPFLGPIGGVRVSRIDGKLVINPSIADSPRSDLDFIVAGTKDAIVMVEGGAKVVPEEEVLDALYFGHEEIKKLCTMQEELRKKAGVEKIIPELPKVDPTLLNKVTALIGDRLTTALNMTVKQERRTALKEIESEVKANLAEEFPEQESEISEIIHDMSSVIMRRNIVDKKIRLDGRNLTTVRPIECEVDVLPRVHGSALFTRGETQAIVTTTLGTSIDAQRIDSLTDSKDKTFMLHYNFPPYSTGEAKMMRGTGRREFGHGALAERALRPVLPAEDSFPYVLRIVSDITESNGSSSMASVCGGTMSMLAAGVKIQDSVAGVAMGLIKEGDKVAVLTDILGDEDHFGDMDFKVCGTKNGITALQMDIKCTGLSRETMETALSQAKEGRLHILSEMSKCINSPREHLSPYAPQILTMKINPTKIRDVIGPGGKTIRSIVETTGAKIDIDDSGTVKIASPNNAACERAKEIILGLTEEAEIGKIYNGIVKKIMDFGAFVEILPGTEGLLHISQISHDRVNSVSDFLSEGDEVPVRVLDVDKQGKIRLSHKDTLPREH